MKKIEERLAWALEVCRKAQMRTTPVRHAILSYLSVRHLPVTLETISRADQVAGHCDPTTVYRTLMMFKEASLVRLVGTPSKTSHFVLNVPGENKPFLICRRCGCITELALPESMCKSIGKIAAGHGFSCEDQDCEVHGYCQPCQTARQKEIVPSKLSFNPR